MTVRRAQNSGIPESGITSFPDGTSNTMAKESTKPATPFSKDSFESGLKAGSSEVLYEKIKASTPRGEASGLKADSNEVAVEGFMDYTDD
jgi:hypothetical protein